MRISASLAALVLAGALAGCASLAPEDCATADWYSAGLEDGRAGHAADAEAGRAAACASEVSPEHSRSYAAGRAAGLADYCTLAGGIRAGRDGEAYAGVCSDETEEEFLTGYYLGALSEDP